MPNKNLTTVHVADWQRFMIALRQPDTYRDIGYHAIQSIIILLIILLIIRIVEAIIDRSVLHLSGIGRNKQQFLQEARRRTFAALLTSLVRYFLYFIAAVWVLAIWNFNIMGVIGTALGTAGILGLVIGFGAQKLVRDLFSGVFILAEDQYSVGDTVTIGAVTGVVEDVGLRVSRIRDDIGRLNIIPNGDIAQVTNHSRGSLIAVVEIGVPSQQDLNAVRKAVKEAGVSVMDSEHGPVVGLATFEGMSALDGAKMTLRITAPAAIGQQKAAEMALRSALRIALVEAEIPIV